MKKEMIILVMVVLSMVVIGCGFLPSEPPIEGEEEMAEEAEEEEAAPAMQEAATEEIIMEVVEGAEEGAAEEEEAVEEAEEAAEEGLQISGSLDLQSDLGLCPHLARNFECDRYDIRRCEFKMSVGANEFYPDLMNCRDGNPEKGENPDNKYCLVQSCAPLQEENIVYAYGGTIAYAEYVYGVEKIGGGIMTHYTLSRCGEWHKEFDTSFDCTVYKAELEGIWVD